MACSGKLSHWSLIVNSLNPTTTTLLALVSHLPYQLFSCTWFLFLSFFAFTFPPPSISSQPSQILTVCCTSRFFFPGMNVGHRSDSRKAVRSRSSAALLFLLHSARSQQLKTERIYVYCCLTLTQRARVEGQTAAYSSTCCTGFTKSWSVSALYKPGLLHITLHINEDDLKHSGEQFTLSTSLTCDNNDLPGLRIKRYSFHSYPLSKQTTRCGFYEI